MAGQFLLGVWVRFYNVSRYGKVGPHPVPYAVLRDDNWDDFHFRTLFDIELHLVDQTVDLGQVKILEQGQDEGRPSLDASFTVLSSSFCSLGQDIEYYEKLSAIPIEIRDEFLRAMRDVAFDPSIELAFENELGWRQSLLRFGQAENALVAGRRLLLGDGPKKDKLSFHFNWRHHGGSTSAQFDFDDSGDLPGRYSVLIGYNGAGKTTLLADLAVAASKHGSREKVASQASALSGSDTTFGSVIAVSYSAFDTFETPAPKMGPSDGRTEQFGYIYCGLRKFEAAGRNDEGTSAPVEGAEADDNESNDDFRLKSIGEIELEFVKALGDAGRREEQHLLVDAFDTLALEPSFGRIGVDLRELGQGANSSRIRGQFQKLSTGHKIVLNIVTQLAAHLRTRSIVLIDEPETHLHPPLAAALLRAVLVLLRGFDSFAIVATHSPVIVQEVPARFVRILQRLGDDTTLIGTEIETFGASIGPITRHVFSLDSSATDYQGILRRLAQSRTLGDIEGLFERGLSPQARLLVLNVQNEHS